MSTHAGQGLPLDRSQWPPESLEFEKAVTAEFLPHPQGEATLTPVIPPPVTPTAVPPTAVPPTSTPRYDDDGDGLIEVTNLEQLDAIRHDLDGDGKADDHSGINPYAAAYPVSGEEVVCNSCTGYELARPLDFAAAESYIAGKIRQEWTTGEGWMPIGDGWRPFAATFNGNGHTVSSLYITPAIRPDSATIDGFGLFGTVGESGVVRESGLLNARVAGGHFVGTLAGINRGVVTRSYGTGRVSGYACIGGLVGSNDSGVISSSYATGSVSGGYIYLGGLVGCNNRGRIITSYATGSVSGETRVGGLVGENDGWVTTSYAAGSVKGQKYVGGLVGNHRDGQISASYSVSDVTGSHYVGGLIGGNEGIVTYTYSAGRVDRDGSIAAAETYIGGLVGYNPGIIDSSFWDTETSGHQVGIGIEIGEGMSSNVLGWTTTELQSAEGYTVPYQEWDVTLGIAGRSNTPSYDLREYWDFGTSREYPALKVDFDGDGTATWQEFGNQRGDESRPAEVPGKSGCIEIMDTTDIAGVWGSDCASVSRPGSYARFYTFTLTEPSEVIVDLESQDADTYLYLLQGGGKGGRALASQGSSGRSSRIEHVLESGTYTLEVTTYDSGQTGSFMLTVNRSTLPPPPPTQAPVSTATLPPAPIPTNAPNSTPMPPEPTNTPVPKATATAARDPARTPESVGACGYPDGEAPRGTVDFSMFLLVAPLAAMGWLKFGSRRRHF